MNTVKQQLSRMGLGLCLLAILVAGASAESLKAKLTKEYHLVMSLMMKKDMKKLKAMLLTGTTKDFLYIGEAGEHQNRDQFIQTMEAQLPMVKQFKAASIKIHSVKQMGTTAKVSTEMYSSMVIQVAKGRTMTMNSIEFTDDTWKLVGKKWLLAGIKTTKVVHKNPRSMPGLSRKAG